MRSFAYAFGSKLGKVLHALSRLKSFACRITTSSLSWKQMSQKFCDSAVSQSSPSICGRTDEVARNVSPKNERVQELQRARCRGARIVFLSSQYPGVPWPYQLSHACLANSSNSFSLFLCPLVTQARSERREKRGLLPMYEKLFCSMQGTANSTLLSAPFTFLTKMPQEVTWHLAFLFRHF